MKVLISGGGTGGHVFPAIAIADALTKKDGNTDILFVGANGKIEMDKVPQAGYKIIGLDIKGFKRSFSLDTIVTAWKAAKALFKAINIVKTFKPDVAIGVGGYASGPTLKVASLLGVPTMIQEQNSYAGVTNKLLARKASKIFVAYSGSLGITAILEKLSTGIIFECSAAHLIPMQEVGPGAHPAGAEDRPGGGL